MTRSLTHAIKEDSSWARKARKPQCSPNQRTLVALCPFAPLSLEVGLLRHAGLINFLIGGGNHPYPGNNDATAVLLLVNGQVVLSAIGQANEALNWASFNVTQYIGQTAQIEIVDQNSGGWGHINADQFLAADSPAHPARPKQPLTSWWTATSCAALPARTASN